MKRGFLLGWRSFIISLGVTLQRVAFPLSLIALLFDAPSFFRTVSGGGFLTHYLGALPFICLLWIALGCGLSVALIAYTSEKTSEETPGPLLWAALPFYAAVFSEFYWVPALTHGLRGHLPLPTPTERTAGIVACAACVLAGRALGQAARRDRAARLARFLEGCRSVEYQVNGHDRLLKM